MFEPINMAPCTFKPKNNIPLPLTGLDSEPASRSQWPQAQPQDTQRHGTGHSPHTLSTTQGEKFTYSLVVGRLIEPISGIF